MLGEGENTELITSRGQQNNQTPENSRNSAIETLVDFNETRDSVRLHNQSQETTIGSNRRRFNTKRPPAVDYDQISRMINSAIQLAFANLNICDTNQPPIVSVPGQTEPPDSPRNIFLNNNNTPPNPLTPNYQHSSFHMSPDKVTSTIQSWNVRFDGSMKG
ncbi:hypothetical protein FF38_00240 [Lucilia cuprina]|uniref:Uncharacterized protein n=1 Tax=Lucilia cuprina TaxID=7375 RepID=A0A0L0CQL4_LUCCU|nr:hypothetical protein FF38_00240 [Lucilia cuprina]